MARAFVSVIGRYFRTATLLPLAMAFSTVAFAHDSHVQTDEASLLLRADSDLVHALQKKDANIAGKLLTDGFLWIDSTGKRSTRAEVLATFPAMNNTNMISDERIYGNSGVIRANRGKVNVLRVWTKHKNGWQGLLYQEVTQVEKSETVTSEAAGECVNPCKEIPYQPATVSEKEAIASWQRVMKAMAENDADAYRPLIADEFTATDTFHDRPYTKSDRVAQIQRLKESGKHNAPPELLSAEMFDLGETVLMVAREQRRGAKAYFNSRMWVKRDARWEMLFSFNTRID